MKNVMARAWEIAREAQVKFGGKVREYFAYSLRLAWAETKVPADRIELVKEVGTKIVTLYGVRDGKVFRTYDRIDAGTSAGANKYKEAYGSLVFNFGLKTACFYNVENGVKTFAGIRAV